MVAAAAAVRLPMPRWRWRQKVGGGIGGLIILVIIVLLRPAARSTDRRRRRHGAGSATGARRPTIVDECKTGAGRQRGPPTARVGRRRELAPVVLGGRPARADRAGRSSPRPRRDVLRLDDTGCGRRQRGRRARSTARSTSTSTSTPTFFNDMLQGQLGGQGRPVLEAYVHRPRVRPPHPGPARHDGQGADPAGPQQRRRAARAAGRLLRRHVGEVRHHRPRTPAASPTSSTSPRRTCQRASTRPRPSATTGSSSELRPGRTPTSWTHGSAEQRMRWFTTGMHAGHARGLRHLRGRPRCRRSGRQRTGEPCGSSTP